MSEIGHNSGDKSFAQQRIKSFVERIERLEEEKKNLGTDLKEVYSEAKSGGLDPKILRQVVKIRKQDKQDLAEQEAILALYLEAVGDLAETPLGQAAVGRVGKKG